VVPAGCEAASRTRVGDRIGRDVSDDIGQDIGTAVGITTGVLALVGGAVWYYLRHRKESPPPAFPMTASSST
jgi:hypothetical protein